MAVISQNRLNIHQNVIFVFHRRKKSYSFRTFLYIYILYSA